MAMYIECIEMNDDDKVSNFADENDGDTLLAPVHVRLSVVNQMNPEAESPVVKQFNHTFAPTATDWGYSDIIKPSHGDLFVQKVSKLRSSS